MSKPTTKAQASTNSLTQTAAFSFRNVGGYGKSHGITAIAYSPDGAKLIAADEDGMLKLWNVATASVQVQVKAPSQRDAIAVAYSADGATIVTSADDVKIWDAKTLQRRHAFNHQGQFVKALAISPNGKWIATGIRNEDINAQSKTYRHNIIMLRDVMTGNTLLNIPTGVGMVMSLAFSPDGQALVSVTNDQNITLWDTKTGNKIRYFDIHNYINDQEYANVAAFSPNGLIIATGGMNKKPDYGVLKLWNASDATNIQIIKEGKKIKVLTFSHDGKKLATANSDGRIRIYEVASGKKLVEFFEHKNNVTSIAFSSDDKTLASGSTAATINFWKVN